MTVCSPATARLLLLACYDGAFFAGRREMFEMNLRMKEEESE